LHAIKLRSFRWLNAALAVFITFAGVGLTGVHSSEASTASVSRPAAEVGVSTTNWTYVCSGSCDISGFTSTVRVVVWVANGFVKVDSTTGFGSALTGYPSANWTNGTVNEIAFTSSQSNANSALETLQYKANGSGTYELRISVSDFREGTAVDPSSGHFYEIVYSPNVRWEDARCRAKYGDSSLFTGGTSWTSSTRSTVNSDGCSNTGQRRTLNGLNGYLANITSLEEHQFLRGKISNVGWIGGSDHTTDGIWQWNDGPASEKGKVFFVQAVKPGYPTVSTVRVNNTIDGQSMFNYFSAGEPNGLNGSESFAEFGFGNNGVGSSWNDCQNACNRSYFIVEYGDDGGTASSATTSFNVLIPVAPTITSTPAPTSNGAGGALFPGSVLTAAFTYDGAPTPSKSFTWQSTSSIGGTPVWQTISGATSETYTITPASVGKFIRAVVTASNVGGTTAATPSSPTAVVGLPALVRPDLDPNSDSGVSSSDDRTSDNTPTLDFTGVAEGATVTATATKASSTSVTCTTAIAGVSGAVSCTLGTLSDGTWSITATQNLNAQSSTASPSLSVIVDTANPFITDTSVTRDGVTANQVNVTLTFSDSVTLNDIAGLTVTSGWSKTTPQFSGSNVSFSATKTGVVSDRFTVTVSAGFAMDSTGNTSTEATSTLQDNLAPTLSMIATGGSSSSTRDIRLELSGNEPLDCSTISQSDFNLTKLRIDDIAADPNDATKCLIEAVSLVSPGNPDDSIIEAKNSGFSVSDSEGVVQTSIATGSSVSVLVTIANPASGGVQVTPITGNVPPRLPFAPPARVMGDISQSAQEALVAANVVSAPAGSSGIRVESDFSHITESDPISASESHVINTGEKVELRIRVSPSTQSTHDTVAYMKKGETWFYLGRSSFDTDWANSDAISLGDPGNYVFRVFLVTKSQVVETSSFSISSHHYSVRVLENFVSLTSGLTDASVEATSDQSLRVDVTVNGAAVPVASRPTPSASPTTTPTPSVAPSPTQSSTPRPSASPAPSPTASEAPIAAPSPEPTPSPSFIPATSIPPITPAPGVQVAPQPNEPASPLDRLSPTINLPEINPGEPIANPAIGATGDDDAPPQEFSPLSSQEGVVAAAQTATAAVTIAAGVAAAAAAAIGAAGAAAAGAAGAAGAGASGASGSASSSSGGSNSTSGGDGEGDLAEIEVVQESLTIDKQNWGDKLWLFTLPFMTFLDRRSHNTAERVARFSPFVAKLVNDGAYLRAMLGTLSVLGPVLAAIIGVIAVNENAAEIAAGDYSKIITPAWQFLLAIAVLGALDASSGFVGATVFIIGSLITVGHIPDAGEIRTMMGIMLIAVGPGMLATAFRTIRKDAATDSRSLWERATDFAIAPFMAGWSVSAMVAGMPALAGLTLDAANHVADFALFVALATVVRVLLEEFAARYFPYRLNKINPDEIPDPSNLQKAIVLVIKYGIWVFIGGALIGPSWQVWVGSALFVFPAVLSWYQDRFPNIPAIWRVLPTGLPGLAFTLFVASATTTTVSAVVGSTPQLAQWAFLILPMPLLILSLLGMFGRHGKVSRRGIEEERFSQRNQLVYRIGGVLMLVVTLKLAGVI